MAKRCPKCNRDNALDWDANNKKYICVWSDCNYIEAQTLTIDATTFFKGLFKLGFELYECINCGIEEPCFCLAQNIDDLPDCKYIRKGGWEYKKIKWE